MPQHDGYTASELRGRSRSSTIGADKSALTSAVLPSRSFGRQLCEEPPLCIRATLVDPDSYRPFVRHVSPTCQDAWPNSSAPGGRVEDLSLQGTGFFCVSTDHSKLVAAGSSRPERELTEHHNVVMYALDRRVHVSNTPPRDQTRKSLTHAIPNLVRY